VPDAISGHDDAGTPAADLEPTLEEVLRPSGRDIHVPFLGARKKAHELANEVVLLEQALDRVGGLSLLEVEERRDALSAEIEVQRIALEHERSSCFGRITRKLTTWSAA
jgi:hypothetical protein